MKNRRVVGIALFSVGTLLVQSSSFAATGSLSIGTVGGQQVRNGRVAQAVSGRVDVTGSASIHGASEPAAPPLVADAGDSPFVASGDPATLVGMAFGGTAPYRYAWSSSVGTLAGADGAAAQLDTTGLAPGRYPVSFTVTDATGAVARDTVTMAVYQRTQRTILQETQVDPGPGVIGVGVPAGTLVYDFEVPPATERIDVAVTWTAPTNDYDITINDPAGDEQGSSAGGPPSTQEATSVADPDAGAGWTVNALKFATVADQVTASVIATVGAPDPRASVSAGGPYRFLIGAAQRLDGNVTGGTGAVRAAWDLDNDGVFETAGSDVAASLAPGRHLVTLKATDAAGLERRQTTSVLVADAARLAQETSAFTVIGIADTGINPYHLEFSAATYPDPDVLALTDGFTRHPSEYVPGYPAGSKALDITLGRGYFPDVDAPIWNGNTTIQPGELYWIPGTKIIGAVDAGGSTGATSSDDPHPILDDNGHGSGSASVSTGNRYGYCPTCLLVVVEGLDETVATDFPWVDISSHSFGYVGGLPIGLVVGANEVTRQATERGQTVLFAAGNGIGNAFDVPIATYGSDQTGPDWTITVGALRRDNQRAVVGDGIPVHISAWGDGNLPSACRTGTVGQCAFGGTSAATPYTAGVFGTVLTEVRNAVGDPAVGQRTVGAQGQVVADGVPVADSVYLDDGLLTRHELREAVLKTAFPLSGEQSLFPYPLTAPYDNDTNVLFEGYGAATPEGARRAIDVLLGRALLPDRESEDEFFALDRQVRDTLYGGYDRTGNGESPDDFQGLAGGASALGVPLEQLSTLEGALAALGKVAALRADAVAIDQTTGPANPITYYLHRHVSAPPGTSKTSCTAGTNESYMDRADTAGDLEPCFESRVTSVVAAYRPLGIFAATDTLEKPLPAGSRVTVDLYLATETPAVVRPTGVLMATDREIGEGRGTFQPVLGSGPAGVACDAIGNACYAHYQLSFLTTRPAFAGEALTFQVQLIGTRSWAFGYEGGHASRVTINPAPVPETGFAFGAQITSPADRETLDGGDVVLAGGVANFPDQGTDPTGAGDHPTDRRVEVSLDDATFAEVVQATLNSDGTWSAPLRDVGDGAHTLYARARAGERTSPADTVTFTVRPADRVEWQVVDRNATPDPAAWRDAAGFSAWRFGFDTATYGRGAHTIVTRLVSDGTVLAQRTAAVRFK